MRLKSLLTWGIILGITMGIVFSTGATAPAGATIDATTGAVEEPEFPLVPEEDHTSSDPGMDWRTSVTVEAITTDVAQEAMLTIGEASISEVGFLFLAYSRHNDANPLDHEIRAELHSIVSQSPGLSLALLARRSSQPRSTIRYHVKVLESEQTVQRSDVWGKSRLFPLETASDEFAFHAIEHESRLREITGVIAEQEPATVTEIADEVDRAASTVSYHLGRLEDAGVIEREEAESTVVSELSPAFRSFVNEQATQASEQRATRLADANE